MQLVRPAIAVDPRFFGKARKHSAASELVQPPVAQQLSSDIKLFATTFAAGFVFVSILLA